MDFSFGSAAALYRKRVHPRVLISPGDIATLRRMIKSGDGLKLMNGLRRKVAPIVQGIRAADDLPKILAGWNASFSEAGTKAVMALDDIALVGLLDEDATTIDAAKLVLTTLAEADRIIGRDGVKNVGYGLEPRSVMAYDLLYHHMTPAERRAVCDWYIDFNVDYVLKRSGASFFRYAGANIPMCPILTALAAVLSIEGDEGVRDLSAARAELILKYEAAVNSTLSPDGYPWEDISYGSGMAAFQGHVGEALRRAGLFDFYKQCPRYKNFGQSMLHFVQPWGNALCNTGDHSDNFGDRSFTLARLATVTRDKTLLWLLGTLYAPTGMSGPGNIDREYNLEVPLKKGAQWGPHGFRVQAMAMSLFTLPEMMNPQHPSKSRVPMQYHDRERGLVTFRSSWKDDATFVLLDGAQRSAGAQGHEHDSGGHFSLSALGEYFAIDTGRYNIEQDQHNVVLVNGKSGRSTNGEWRMSFYHANLTSYAPGKFVDFTSVDTSHQSDCFWARRHLGLVKGALPYVWTVEDVNKDHCMQGPHEWWWTLNTHPENKIRLHKESATIEGQKRGNLLDIHFALPNPKFYASPHTLTMQQDVQLGGSRKYILNPAEQAEQYRKQTGDMVHGPVFARPRLIANVHGLSGRFMSVMIPRKKGEKPPVVERLDSLDSSLALSIKFRGFEDTLIWAYEHNLLEAGDVVARGNWVVVRRKAGKVVSYEMGDGSSLTVGKKTLV